MGVATLWKYLTKEGQTKKLIAAAPESQHAEIVAHVDGKVIAVDTSVWLVEAQTNIHLAEAFQHNQKAVCLKVLFERSMNWLRYGCTPVFVFEGISPEAKRDLLNRRQGDVGQPSTQSRAARPHQPFRHLNRVMIEMLEALGLPYVQATGEAEATCAALCIHRLVDGCQSKDVDTLLFGAESVYKTLKLQVDNVKECKMELCTLSSVRRSMGLRSGGSRALIAMAELMGGDYDSEGAKGVGHCQAFEGIRTLLAGSQDDNHVLDLLDAALHKGPDPHLLSLTNCSGCKQCGHESNNKSCCKAHGKGGCQGCGTTAATGGPGGCIFRKFENCECEFHRRQDERWLAKVVNKARSTDGFLLRCATAQETYLSEEQQAGEAVANLRPGCFSWSRRPDVPALTRLFGIHLQWTPQEVCRKLLPLLLDWDLLQGPNPAPGLGVQFFPVAIQKTAGKAAGSGDKRVDADGAEDDAATPWRYVLRLGTHPTGNGSGSAFPTQRAAGNTQGGDASEVVDIAVEAQLFASGAKSIFRSARISLIRSMWPDLAPEQPKLKAPPKKPRAKATKAKGMEGQEGALLQYMKPQKAVAVSTKPRAGTSMDPKPSNPPLAKGGAQGVVQPELSAVQPGPPAVRPGPPAVQLSEEDEERTRRALFAGEASKEDEEARREEEACWRADEEEQSWRDEGGWRDEEGGPSWESEAVAGADEEAPSGQEAGREQGRPVSDENLRGLARPEVICIDDSEEEEEAGGREEEEEGPAALDPRPHPGSDLRSAAGSRAANVSKAPSPYKRPLAPRFAAPLIAIPAAGSEAEPPQAVRGFLSPRAVHGEELRSQQAQGAAGGRDGAVDKLVSQSPSKKPHLGSRREGLLHQHQELQQQQEQLVGALEDAAPRSPSMCASPRPLDQTGLQVAGASSSAAGGAGAAAGLRGVLIGLCANDDEPGESPVITYMSQGQHQRQETRRPFVVDLTSP